MMFAQVNGLTTCGIDGVMILVEVDISNGLPNFCSIRYLG